MTDSAKNTEKQDGAASESYKVLARKYRPQHFDELIGQDTLVRTLKNAIESGRIAHAYMLTGVRGVGKTTTARIIAKALNYTGPDGKAGPTTGPTDDCEICRSIAADRHPDIMEMDAASRTGVDDIREILDGVRYAPVSARYKIYIIDEVHMLSKQAFNALLKTLEEPPPHVIFIFATTELRKVPVTVLSRCQRFDLRRIDAQSLQAYYRQICEKENVKLDDSALALIAQSADGSVRDGLSLLDQAIAQGTGEDSSEEVSLEQVQNMLGLSDRGQILSLYETSMTARTPEAIEILEDLFKNGADPKMVLQDLLDLTHILSKSKAANENKTGALMPPDQSEKIFELAEKLSMPSLGRSWDILLKAMRELQITPNPEKSVEMAVIRLSYAANLPDPAELLRQMEGPEATSTKSQNTTTSSSAASSGQNTQKSGSEKQDVTASHNVSPSSEPSSTPQSHLTRLVRPAQSEGGRQNAPAQKGHLEMDYASQADPESAPHPERLETLEGIVATLESTGEIRLAADIRQYVRLVELKPQRLEFNPGEGTPKSLANEIQTSLSKLTAKRWVVSISSKSGAAPLIEKQREAQKAHFREIESHPVVQSILEAFPGAELKNIHPLTTDNTNS